MHTHFLFILLTTVSSFALASGYNGVTCRPVTKSPNGVTKLHISITDATESVIESGEQNVFVKNGVLTTIEGISNPGHVRWKGGDVTVNKGGYGLSKVVARQDVALGKQLELVLLWRAHGTVAVRETLKSSSGSPSVSKLYYQCKNLEVIP